MTIKRSDLVTRSNNQARATNAALPLRGLGLAMLILAAGTATALAGWTNTVVDNAALSGQGLAIATQGPGRAHISYRNAAGTQLAYATNVYGTWTKQTIGEATENVAGSSGIAVGLDGALHISYSNPYNHDIRYATDATGSWVVQGLNLGEADPASAITLDTSGYTHIAANNASTLRYATDASGSFQGTTVKDALNSSIACDRIDDILVSSTGKIYIIHTVGTDLCLTTNKTGAWVQEPIGASGNVGLPATADFDSNGYLHVAWLGAANALKYATNASGVWAIQTVTSLASSTGFSAHVAAAAANNVSISYYTPDTSTIRQATFDGVSWSDSGALYTVSNVASSTMTVDSAGAIWLAYYASNGNLRVVTNDTVGPHGADVAVTQSASPDAPNAVYTTAAVELTIAVTNNGPQDAEGVAVTDVLPAGTTYISSSPSVGAAQQAGGTVTWTVGDVAAFSEETLSILVRMPSVAGTISNVASVTSDAGDDPSDPNDFKLSNNSSTNELAVQTLPVVTYSLSFTVAGEVGGSAAAVNGQTLQAGGTIVPVVATPDEHYRVKQWSGTLHDDWTTDHNEVLMGNQNKAVTVTFERIPHYLATAVVGGHGTLRPLSGYHGEGTSVTLVATPEPHYGVKKWIGTDNDASTEPSNSKYLNGDGVVTVEFQTVPNQPPHASGTVQGGHSVAGGTRVTLDGTASSDPEELPLTYNWEQTGGPTVTLSDPSSATPSFTAPKVTEEQIQENVAFGLTVTDDMGAEDATEVVVKVTPNNTCVGPCCSGVGPGNLIACGALYCLGLFSAKIAYRRRLSAPKAKTGA